MLEKRANVICANMDQHDTDCNNDGNTSIGADDPVCGNDCARNDDDADDDNDDGFHFLSG